MTQCPREEELDCAAVRLRRAGMTPSNAAALPAEWNDLAPLLRHAGECVRCGEILGLLYETERGHVLATLADTEEIQTGRSRSVLPLFPLMGIRSDAPPSRDPVRDEVAEYPVAADSRAARRGKREEAAALVLTLTTQDQRYVVRIFPNQEGSGATAVLLGVESESGQVRSAAPPPGVSLRVGEVEYPFDERGFATLAGFPVGRVALVVG